MSQRVLLNILPVLTEIKAAGETAPIADVPNDCLMCQRATTWQAQTVTPKTEWTERFPVLDLQCPHTLR
jgi:hypothetical protein